jgi:aerobic carbon-monoxide dehydrogenase large subunit
VALAAYVPHNYPLDKLEPGLNETAFYDPTNFTYPAGTYICEVEIDPETGVVRIDRFTAVDDFGTIINPMIVEGQVHGGLVQGIGQALLENCVYDRESGQLLTAASWTTPCRAPTTCPVQGRHRARPARTTRLGTKGCGEAGAIGSPPAVINAVLDALRPLGVKTLDMPATPHRVWQAIQSAQA